MFKKYFGRKHLVRGLKGVVIYFIVLLADYLLLKKFYFDLPTIILGGCLAFVLFWGFPFVEFKAKPEDKKERKIAKITAYILSLTIVFLIVYAAFLLLDILQSSE